MTNSIMVVGTASHVGKSIIATALCRMLRQDGYDVVPFKAQNMSLNSAVTPSGGEIGRAQAVQAEACGVLPNEHMNPVLLKPTGQTKSQIVLQGRVYTTETAAQYYVNMTDLLWSRVEESYAFLAARHDVIVIEGAGSPVEMNLKSRDIANMRMALHANADVLLVVDIDRGGVFASVVGTLTLLSPEERSLVKGVIVNRFRGDPSLFVEGRRMLESLAGVPVVGVIPFIPNLDIDEEDSVALEHPHRKDRHASDSPVRIAVVRLPHIANFTDVDPFFLEPDVDVFFTTRPADLDGVSAVILPGSKNTMDDAVWLRENGLHVAIESAVAKGVAVFGICGGYQLLGKEIRDPNHVESEREVSLGLGFTEMVTTLRGVKETRLIKGRLAEPYESISVEGYEIHMGVTHRQGEHSFATLTDAQTGDERQDGVVLSDGRMIGTYLHGIFHNDAFRTVWLNGLRSEAGVMEQPVTIHVQEHRAQAYDRLAEIVREHLNPSVLEGLLEGVMRRLL